MADLVQVAASDRGLRGTVKVPGDKSLSHRAAMFAALAGSAEVSGLSAGEDVVCTVAALQCMGAEVDGVQWRADALHAAASEIDLGNSGTATRLLMGLVSGIPGKHVLVGDPSLSKRPMERVAAPLRLMGAHITTTDGCPPVVVEGSRLEGIEYQSPVASAQVKSALLLAGLWAGGTTTIVEPQMTRRHTEEFFDLTGCDWSLQGTAVTIRPGRPQPFKIEVPLDPSQAAFWAVAASLVPESDITIESVYVGPGRDGFLAVLDSMGADITVIAERPFSPAVGSRVVDIRVRAAQLRGTEIAGELVGDAIDEIPVLALAAALAEGDTVVRDAQELRVKESDRVATTVAALRALGADAEATPDGLLVRGRPGMLRATAPVQSHLDHRIAMMGAVGALVSIAGAAIEGFSVVETSYPGFLADLESLR